MAKKTLAVVSEPPKMTWLHDKRTDCFSVMVTLPTGLYLEMVKSAHDQRGGITGQRDVLTTTTAKRIRDRMIADIRVGAVLPPVVIGVVVGKQTIVALTGGEPLLQDAFLAKLGVEELSIIDGMQRTASL